MPFAGASFVEGLTVKDASETISGDGSCSGDFLGGVFTVELLSNSEGSCEGETGSGPSSTIGASIFICCLLCTLTSAPFPNQAIQSPFARLILFERLLEDLSVPSVDCFGEAAGDLTGVDETGIGIGSVSIGVKRTPSTVGVRSPSVSMRGLRLSTGSSGGVSDKELGEGSRRVGVRSSDNAAERDSRRDWIYGK